MPASIVACASRLVKESIIVRKNGALRLAVEHSSSKKKSTCEEVDTDKVKGTVFQISARGTRWKADVIPHQNQHTIKLTSRCEVLNALTLADSARLLVCFDSVPNGDPVFPTPLERALCPSPMFLPSSTMREGEERMGEL